MTQTFQPLGTRVLIKPDPQEVRTTGGLYIPESATEKPCWGKVVSTGLGKACETGFVIIGSLRVGDKVYFNKFAGQQITLNGEPMIIIEEENVMGVLK